METLFKIFLEYGWWGILGIILCIGLFFGGQYMIKKINKNMSSGLETIGKELTKEISEQNKELVTKIIANQDKLLDHILDQKTMERKNHNVMLHEKMQLSDEINMSLKDIMNIHNAQRAFILSFHNSGENLSGTPFPKYSCEYEWFDKGLLPLQFKCKNLSFSSLAHIVNNILKSSNQQIIYSIEDLYQYSPSLYALLKDDLSETLIYTAMYDKNNNLIGLLVLEFKKENSLEHVNLNQLHIQAAELISMLNLRYKYIE